MTFVIPTYKSARACVILGYNKISTKKNVHKLVGGESRWEESTQAEVRLANVYYFPFPLLYTTRFLYTTPRRKSFEDGIWVSLSQHKLYREAEFPQYCSKVSVTFKRHRIYLQPLQMDIHSYPILDGIPSTLLPNRISYDAFYQDLHDACVCLTQSDIWWLGGWVIKYYIPST